MRNDIPTGVASRQDVTILPPHHPTTPPPHHPTTLRGRPLPLGPTPAPDGVNFALLCRHGTQVWLVLSPEDSNTPFAEIELDGNSNRTGNHWHVFVQDLPPTFRYAWRVDGPQTPYTRYDSSILLLDPAATLIAGGGLWGGQCEASARQSTRRGLYSRGPAYDWGDDHPPRTPLEDSIIYELHVRGFTCHPSSGVRRPGTYLGLTEKIPYLKSLGVTAVELLPIHEFDECDCTFVNPVTGERLRNFWGYNSIAFAAPKGGYAAGVAEHSQVREFRDMVKAFHAAGIEVILDVVFNHTGEGDDRGRTYSFRGLDNELYYMLGPDGSYLNFTGTGNTLNCNHPIVRDMIMNCLRYWVGRMHVDGFRFDLASVFGRDRFGNVIVDPPIVETITEDGVLADSKLIAEPWDAAGLYQVGKFPFGRRWSEWNGKYRDDVRRFWRGDADTISGLATRLCGSSDLYEPTGRKPIHSINFVTCHDGFTLNDLVSYNEKHNEANGEENRDGSDANWSWNCGVEGPTNDPAIRRLRQRQARNVMATLLLSEGMPMLLAGDEFLRTQGGNNNAWCQDNETSWVDWRLPDENKHFLRFVREMIALRKRHPALRRRAFLFGAEGGLRPDIAWHGMEPNQPDFSPASRLLAYTLDGSQTGREPDQDIYVAINGDREQAIPVRVPKSPSGKPWRRVVDTSLAPPLDIVAEGTGPVVPAGATYRLPPLSLAVLITG